MSVKSKSLIAMFATVAASCAAPTIDQAPALIASRGPT
jgi:hypothetical protein